MKFLKHKTVNLFFTASFLLLIALSFFVSLPFYVFLILGLTWLVMTSIGSFNILWNYHIDSLNYRPLKKSILDKKIALTFDDGPHPIYTPQVLTLLKQYDIKATFFCIGKNVAAHPDLFQQIVAEGHLVGNHTYHHSDFFGFYKAHQVLEELKQTNQVVNSLIGEEMQLFRPPFGVTNPSIKKGLLASGHTSIGWSVRSLDTVIQEKEKILNRITKKMKSGDIILLHDTSQRTVDALKDLLVFLEQQQFEAVRVDDLLEIEPFKI